MVKKSHSRMQASFLSSEEIDSKSYLALARRYRPQTFQDMVGQPVLVKTLTNAINSNRIPHAIILTGIRGVGKTTTARIIARALNCVGIDGKGSEAPEPCGVCASCEAISNDRHQDVIEIDAASHTGVADIREIIDNVRYKPLSARYKIYIIDEVHMLSNNAFNALLKTLEEPPQHVKFIFATTEVRKIPVTILSRCQRFDLRRVATDELVQYYTQILHKEGLDADQGSLFMIANAAQGSVRDGLSMLDQAISLSNGRLDETETRNMLGLADINLIFQLFDHLVSGNPMALITSLKELYNIGADPNMIIQDLLEITNGITKAKVAEHRNISEYPEFEWGKYSYYADKLSIPFLARMWQALLKGLEDMKSAFFLFLNLEMILIRISYISSMPTLDAFITQGSQAIPQPPLSQIKKIDNFEQVIALCLEHKEMLMYHHLISDTKIVTFTPPKIIIKLLENAPQRFHQNIQNFLRKHTDEQWVVEITHEESSQPTFLEDIQEKDSQLKKQIANHELVHGILNTFTGTEILDIKTKKNF